MVVLLTTKSPTHASLPSILVESSFVETFLPPFVLAPDLGSLVWLETAGHPIGGNDMLIAAHALAAGSVLVTDNEREFARGRRS